VANKATKPPYPVAFIILLQFSEKSRGRPANRIGNKRNVVFPCRGRPAVLWTAWGSNPQGFIKKRGQTGQNWALTQFGTISLYPVRNYKTGRNFSGKGIYPKKIPETGSLVRFHPMKKISNPLF
jgi:hypothetical protein